MLTKLARSNPLPFSGPRFTDRKSYFTSIGMSIPPKQGRSIGKNDRCVPSGKVGDLGCASQVFIRTDNIELSASAV